MFKFFCTIALAVTVLLIFFPGYSWAVQSHGGAEGLVSHQVGHFLFTIGMSYLLYRLYTMHVEGVGWFEFKIFLWLLILWNLTTFSGHWMNEFVDNSKFIRSNDTILAYETENISDIIFYLTRLDHLVLVPAFAFLVLALRKWKAQS